MSPPEDRSWGSAFTVGGTALGVFALLGLAFYLIGTGTSATVATGPTTSPVDEASPDTDSLRTASSFPTLLGGAPPGEDGAYVEDEPVANDSDLLTDPEDSFRGTDTTAAPADDPAGTDDSPQPDLAPDPADEIDGVFSLGGNRLDRLGGFIVHEELVFTSSSALGGQQRVALRSGGVWVEAEVVGTDPATDISVLAIDESYEDGSLPAPDDTTIPGGLALTEAGLDVSVEGIDAWTEPTTGRLIGVDHATVTAGGVDVYGTLLTSIAARPGDRGSALVDGAGQVLGIIIDATDYNTAALPLDRVIEIGRSIRETGLPTTAWLGLHGESIEGVGVQVTAIETGGPAALAGVVIGDVIIRIDGANVRTWNHFVHLVRESGVDATVSVEFDRGGGLQTVEAVIGERPLAPLAGS